MLFPSSCLHTRCPISLGHLREALPDHLIQGSVPHLHLFSWRYSQNLELVFLSASTPLPPRVAALPAHHPICLEPPCICCHRTEGMDLTPSGRELGKRRLGGSASSEDTPATIHWSGPRTREGRQVSPGTSAEAKSTGLRGRAPGALGKHGPGS